jgi:P27 family predicted phage terminase small subunit
LKVLRGNPGKRAMRPEVEPNRGAQCPSPPDFLSPHAIEEWHRIGPELHRLGLLTVLDVMPLAAYCQSYAHWRACEEALAKGVGRGGLARASPLLRISRSAADMMMKTAAQFAMTPAARARIAAGVGPQPEPPSKFDGLI